MPFSRRASQRAPRQQTYLRLWQVLPPASTAGGFSASQFRMQRFCNNRSHVTPEFAPYRQSPDGPMSIPPTRNSRHKSDRYAEFPVGLADGCEHCWMRLIQRPPGQTPPGAVTRASRCARRAFLPSRGQLPGRADNFFKKSKNIPKPLSSTARKRGDDRTCSLGIPQASMSAEESALSLTRGGPTSCPRLRERRLDPSGSPSSRTFSSSSCCLPPGSPPQQQISAHFNCEARNRIWNLGH